jgi:hypothetical protein
MTIEGQLIMKCTNIGTSEIDKRSFKVSLTVDGKIYAYIVKKPLFHYGEYDGAFSQVLFAIISKSTDRDDHLIDRISMCDLTGCISYFINKMQCHMKVKIGYKTYKYTVKSSGNNSHKEAIDVFTKMLDLANS